MFQLRQPFLKVNPLLPSIDKGGALLLIEQKCFHGWPDCVLETSQVMKF